MVTIDSTALRRDGVTLVTATLEGDPTPTRVTIESRLDGPIWPPRRQGTPATGWTADGFEGDVPADGQLPLGFASPAPPVDQPLTITSTEPAAESTDDMDTPAAIVRGLGDPSPPSMVPDEGRDADAPTDETAVSGPPARTVAAQSPQRRAEEPAEAATDEGNEEVSLPEPTLESGSADPADATSLPPAVEDWLSSVDERIERAEALRANADVSDAAAALRECDGLADAGALDGTLSADATRLRTVEERLATLAERAETTTVATDAIDRLA